jgi:hypothetical protein
MVFPGSGFPWPGSDQVSVAAGRFLVDSWLTRGAAVDEPEDTVSGRVEAVVEPERSRAARRDAR